MKPMIDAVTNIVSGPLAADLAIALLHTLWQALAVAAGLYVLLKKVVTSHPGPRYALAVAGMVLIVGCPMLTLGVLRYEAPAAAVDGTASNASAVEGAQAAEPVTPAVPSTVPAEYGPTPPDVTAAAINWHGLAVCLWLAGVVFMLARAVWMVYGAARLRRSCEPVHEPHLDTLVDALRQKMRIGRRIGIAAVDRIASPAVVGFVRPTILLPLSMMSGMAVDDISAILAHELAHVRRFDCLVNFCQMIVEALLFFNPAVWWVSRQIRVEREACCDAASVAMTGQKLGYARLLYAWAVRVSDVPGMAAAAMVAFGQKADNGHMLDRIQRIVVKGHRPRVHFSAAMTIAMLAAAGILLFGLWHGTRAGVALAGKMLTPQERIDRMAEIHKSHGRPAHDPDYSGNLPKDKQVTLGGIVRTWDGLPLPQNTCLTVHYSYGNSSTTQSVSVNHVEPGHATFSTKCGYGTVYVFASADGYAPFCAGPFEFEPGETKTDLEIVFQESLYAEVQLVDADSGEPIEGVDLRGGHNFRPGGYNYTIGAKTDAQGRANIVCVENVPVTFVAKADLYEDTLFEKLTLSPNAPLVLTLRKGLPTTGIVVSAATGEPVAGAQIRIQRSRNMGYGRDQGDVLATTGLDGRFTIMRLNSQNTYILAIKADGFAYAFVPEVKPGDQDIEVRLRNEIIIRGQVVGPLEGLPNRKGQTAMPYVCGYEYDNSGEWSAAQYASITETDDGAFFEVTDVWGNRIDIGSLHYRIRLDLDKDEVPELLIINTGEKLTPDGKPFTTRTLVLQFNVPQGAPPINGNVRIFSQEPGKMYNSGKLIDVTDNRAEMEVIVPGDIGYQLADTIGYWFAEQHQVKVEAGAEPYVVSVDVVPAGMIFGEVFQHDGSPATNTMVSFETVEKSPVLGEVQFGGVRGKDGTSESERRTKYGIQPLPLGGKYRVIPHQGYMYLVSETVTLTEDQPIRQLDLALPEGVTLKGKVLHPDGSPAAGIDYDLGFVANGGGSFGHGERATDVAGGFACENVNPNPDGKYILYIRSRKTWRPQAIEITDFHKELTVALAPGAVVEGRIVDDETGWPIPGVEISAYYFDARGGNSEHPGAESKTDKDGRFRFSTLQKGRTYRPMTSDCRIVEPISPEITGGQGDEITLRVKLYDWSSLKPQKPE